MCGFCSNLGSTSDNLCDVNISALWIQSMEKGILFITRFLEMKWRRLPRGTHQGRKNSLFIKNRTQMSPDIGRFEVMNECKFGISLFRGLLCFLCAFKICYKHNLDALFSSKKSMHLLLTYLCLCLPKNICACKVSA